ncbi:MAG: diphthamide biosynthesis enzyme Dph2 [Candidatus Aenigmatarchaeota archaeon]|nr:MAG: diphthamide biosynthesis enzyme Dph2 [Candidatus Aenigmarchaeota archaeon]
MKNVEELVRAVVQSGAKKIFLQLPEGLKTYMTDIVWALNNVGIDCVVSAEPCYGACDLRDKEAEMLDCELLVHVGHNKFYKAIKTCLPVLYFTWPVSIERDKIEKILEKEIKKIKQKRIGLVTTVQHLGNLDEIVAMLKELKKEPIVGGQILGCWTRNAKKIDALVDCFLFVGSGIFHPLAIETEKPIFIMDLEKGEIRNIEQERLEARKRKMARIEKAKDAEMFGILISTKPGQVATKKDMEKIKKLLKAKNKKFIFIEMNNITGDKLLGIKVDAFVNTACPRIAENKFEKPVVNMDELDML